MALTWLLFQASQGHLPGSPLSCPLSQSRVANLDILQMFLMLSFTDVERTNFTFQSWFVPISMLSLNAFLFRLINKLQPGSVKKVNESSLNWPQLENIGNFIKAIQAYGMKPHDIFEANDLFENGNMTQVQTTLVALAGLVRICL